MYLEGISLFEEEFRELAKQSDLSSSVLNRLSLAPTALSIMAQTTLFQGAKCASLATHALLDCNWNVVKIGASHAVAVAVQIPLLLLLGIGSVVSPDWVDKSLVQSHDGDTPQEEITQFDDPIRIRIMAIANAVFFTPALTICAGLGALDYAIKLDMGNALVKTIHVIFFSVVPAIVAIMTLVTGSCDVEFVNLTLSKALK